MPCPPAIGVVVEKLFVNDREGFDRDEGEIISREIEMQLVIAAARNFLTSKDPGHPFHMLALEPTFPREVDGEDSAVEPVIQF